MKCNLSANVAFIYNSATCLIWGLPRSPHFFWKFTVLSRERVETNITRLTCEYSRLPAPATIARSSGSEREAAVFAGYHNSYFPFYRRTPTILTHFSVKINLNIHPYTNHGSTIILADFIRETVCVYAAFKYEISQSV